MLEILSYLGHGLIILGLFFILSAIIGIRRFEGVLPKIHAAGVADSLGYSLCYLGLAFLSCESNLFFKYILILVIILIVSPLVSHTIAKLTYETEKLD